MVLRTRSVVIIIFLCLLVIAIIATVVVLVVRSRQKKKTIDFESFFFSDLNVEELNLISDALQEKSRTFALDVRDEEFTRYVGIRPNDVRLGPNYKMVPYYEESDALAKVLADIFSKKEETNCETTDLTNEEKLRSLLLEFWGQKEMTVEQAKAVVRRIPSIVGFVQEKKASPTIASKTYFFTGDEVFASEDRNGYTLFIKNDRLKNIKTSVVFQPPRDVASNNWAKYDNLMVAGAVVHGPDPSMTIEDAKKWCAANYASHFEVRPGKGIVIKSMMLLAFRHAREFDCGTATFSEGLMEDTPEGRGTTYIRLDMTPHGKRLYYQDLLERFQEMKRNSTCDSNCVFLEQWLPWLEIIGILLIPATSAATAGLGLSFLKELAIEGAIVAVADVPLIIADRVISNAADNAKIRLRFLEQRFKRVAPLENLDKVNKALEKKLGRSGLSFQARMQLAMHDWRLTEMCKCTYGNPCQGWTPEEYKGRAREEVEMFESVKKAPYNYSSTFYNFLKFTIERLKSPWDDDCGTIYRYIPDAPKECPNLPFREAIGGQGISAPKGVSQYPQHYSDDCEPALQDASGS